MTGKVISRFFCAVEFGEFGQGGINQKRKFIRISVRISIKSADFRTKRASSCKKRSKTIENIRKFAKNVPKYSKFVSKLLKIFESFLPPCAFD